MIDAASDQQGPDGARKLLPPFATSTGCRHRLRNLPPGNQAVPSGVRRGLVDWLIA